MDRAAHWAHVQWLAVPRRLMLRFPAARGIAGDGHVVLTMPVVAVVLPGAVLLLGLLSGLLRLGYEDVYTESIVLLVAMVLIGFFSSQLGVLVVVGFCLGDFLTAERFEPIRWTSSTWFSGVLGQGPLATIAHDVLPRLITYLLLAAAVVVLPRAARAVVGTVGRGRRLPPLGAWGLVSALLVVIAWLGMDAWVAAAPTLVRPLFTWSSPNGVPTVEAVATLQETGGVVVAAAVIGTVLRQMWVGAAMIPGAVQDRLRAAEEAEDGASPAEREAAGRAEADGGDVAAEELLAQVRVPPPPGTTRRVGAAVVTAVLATLTMAGILEQLWLWFAAFGVLLAVRLLRTTPRHIGWLERWRRVAALLPAWARLITLWLLSRVVVAAISNDAIGSYTALGVFVLVSIVVVFAFFPGEPRPDGEAGTGADGGPADESGGTGAGPATGQLPDTRRSRRAGRPSAQPGTADRTGGASADLLLDRPAGADVWPVPLTRRRRLLQVAVGAWVVAALGGLVTATPAAADNCSVFTDCFGVANSAVEAAFGLALLAALSMVLDFIPVVGTAKGVVEAITGRDLLTGQELAWWERALGVVPILAGLGALGAAARMGRNVPTPPRVPDVPRTPDIPRTPDAPRRPGRESGGAREYPRRPKSDLRQDEWADDMYAGFRSDPDLVPDLARHNPDLDPGDIDRAMRHVLEDEHLLGTSYGSPYRGRFDSDATMAEAFDRLRSGQGTPTDRLLLQHEIAESRYMDAHPGASYEEAHRHATSVADWDGAVRRERGD